MRRRGLGPTPAALLIAGLAGGALAGEVTVLGPLEIDRPWARASIGTGRPSAAYLTIRNTGAEPDRLIAVETPVAARADVHEMAEEGGTMKMRPPGPLEIPPGGEVRLEPGGLHIMLMQLRAPLAQGGEVPLTLLFEKAGEVTVNAPVGPIGASAPPD
jgi:copper(I)-binding protein